jgi:hypothetical protein
MAVMGIKKPGSTATAEYFKFYLRWWYCNNTYVESVFHMKLYP